ncbi:MAG: sterol desaturase family protein [Myxococcales bacterium]|nr:sterol desaturase family protein [Myxococcales bacterium]
MFTLHSIAAWLLVLVAVEAAVLRVTRRRGASENDYLSSLFCGLLDQLVNVGAFVAFVGVYRAVRDAYAPWPLPTNPLTWALVVLAHDLAYYAFHRASHRVAFLWAAHEVHHQSESYTLAVSLRQGTVATWVSWAFYLPLAFVGFGVEQFVIVHGAHQLFQFFVHTRLVDKLGPLEWLLATPSHHRVHHGREEAQIDRNYGGFLIVWDRLFGTFTPETKEPVYGVPDEIQSWSPYWANLEPYRRLLRKALRARSLREAIATVFGPPRSEGSYAPSSRLDAPPADLRVYTAVQTVGVLWITNIVLRSEGSFGPVVRGAMALWVLVSLGSISAMADGRPTWRSSERARIALTATSVATLAATSVTSWVPSVFWLAACALSAYELERRRP